MKRETFLVRIRQRSRGVIWDIDDLQPGKTDLADAIAALGTDELEPRLRRREPAIWIETMRLAVSNQGDGIG